jgi:hypothetical protein
MSYLSFFCTEEYTLTSPLARPVLLPPPEHFPHTKKSLEEISGSAPD